MAVAFYALRHPLQSALFYKESLKNSLSERVASCANALKQFHASYLDGMSPFRKSILGRMAFGLGFETVGALVGASMGGALMGMACKRLAPVLAAAGLGGSLYSLRGKLALVGAASLCVPCALYVLPAAFNLMALWIGESGFWIGANVGMVLGGYAGLHLFGSRIAFWDRTDSCDTYVVGMSKSVLVGEVFQRVIVRSTLPIACYPINLCRTLIRQVVQMMAYNSGSVIRICKSLFREKELSHTVIIPLVAKSLCNKYCETNAIPLTQRLVGLLASTIGVVPWVEQKIQFLLNLEFFQKYCQRTIEIFGQNSHKVTAALMRGFIRYVELAQEAESMDHLKEKIPKESLAFINQFCSTHIDSFADSILSSIQEAGENLYGNPIPMDVDTRKPLLSLHMKYFLADFLCHLDFNLLKSEEEQTFILKLTEIFACSFNQPCHSHRMIKVLSQGIQMAVPPVYFWREFIRKYIEQPEERAYVNFEIHLPPGVGEQAPPVHVTPRVDPSQYEQVSQEDALAACDDYKANGDFPALAAAVAALENVGGES